MKQATAKLELENESAIVTRWTFEPGTATGWHTHAHDYVVIPTISGTLTIIQPDGSEVETPITAGAPYARMTGVEHDVQNRTDAVVEFLEVEIKKPG
ncbi:cupin domain-containing protein [Roseovarius spongiae]|uniref:Cupin domain-containing protein n=1 Tax=Roseovarius spongiae TaxID=2320272 RepID=A0A3A8BBR5_9RHOB|nr:cupin domain-containing protein [Roseovarius spongiae]RKF16944.1 cupin domain-containing protein [Roseovarius spongiae]